MKIGLFAKLLLAFAATGILVVTLAGFLIDRQLKSGQIRSIEDEMTAGAQIIALMPMEEIADHAVELAERSRSRLTLIDAAGRVITDTDHRNRDMDSHLNRPEIQEARLKGRGTSIRYSRSLRMDMLYVALPIGDKKRPKGYVRLSRSLHEVAGSTHPLRQAVFTYLLLVVFFSLLIALLFSRRLIAPIGKLAAYAEKARTGKVAGKIRIPSRDEIGTLAESISGMVEVLHEKIRNADQERRQLQSVFAGMVEGIVVLDRRNRIERINRGMEEMISSRSGGIIGRTILEAFRNTPLHDALERFRSTGEKVVLEITLGDDKPVVLDVTITAVQGDDGGERKTLLVFHDMTRLKKLERIRTDFVANLTHEIRTPLTAIIGFVETLRQGAIDDRGRAQEYLRILHENALRLNRLVDDLLILSGIEGGDTGLKLESLNIDEVLDQTLALVAERLSEQKLTLLTDFRQELPPVRADRDRLTQVLLNILDNAVKFTPEGGTVSVTASRGTHEEVIVRIADTGIGIPQSDIPRLGERFYRVDRTRSRGPGGSGLGLSIVRHLLRLLGGRMAIESAPGRGTAVSLHFPIGSGNANETKKNTGRR